jgi:hypothetical protein
MYFATRSSTAINVASNITVLVLYFYTGDIQINIFFFCKYIQVQRFRIKKRKLHYLYGFIGIMTKGLIFFLYNA